MVTASIITCLIGMVASGAVLARVTPREQRWLTLACFLATTPMSWVMFHGVRMPLDAWLKVTLGDGELLQWIRTAYAPLTEEPAKLWPLLIPAIRRAIIRTTAPRYAVALGAGFAWGEVITVAGLVAARQPKIAALPWFELTGFINERLMTFAIHSAMTAIALVSWRRGPGLAAGVLLAMVAHWLSNFPITMSHRGWLGPNQQIAQMLIGFWVAACFILALAWLGWLDIGRVGLGSYVFGRAECPGCGHEFERRLIRGLTFGDRRYEPCPKCGKWHWTKHNFGIARSTS